MMVTVLVFLLGIMPQNRSITSKCHLVITVQQGQTEGQEALIPLISLGQLYSLEKKIVVIAVSLYIEMVAKAMNVWKPDVVIFSLN